MEQSAPGARSDRRGDRGAQAWQKGGKIKALGCGRKMGRALSDAPYAKWGKWRERSGAVQNSHACRKGHGRQPGGRFPAIKVRVRCGWVLRAEQRKTGKRGGSKKKETPGAGKGLRTAKLTQQNWQERWKKGPAALGGHRGREEPGENGRGATAKNGDGRSGELGSKGRAPSHSVAPLHDFFLLCCVVS